MEENKKFSKKKISIILMTALIFIIAIIFKLQYDTGSSINTAFFLVDVGLFLGFMGIRLYKDWKIKEEMYYLNLELRKVSSSYITFDEYEKISKDFLEGKYSTLVEEWNSFAESVFFENGIAFQTVDAELFFNDSTLLKERMNKRLLDYVPQLLLAIGIFGTFFGLVLGLSGLDLSAGDNTQLNNLIDGTKVSFLTSLYGMYFSIAISSLMNFHIGDYEENILKIKNNLNRVFKQALAEQSLIKIEKELGMIRNTNSEMLEKLTQIKAINKGMSVAIGKELVFAIQSYNETNEKYMESVTKIVKTNISGLAEDVSSMFEEKMRKIFSDEFISKFENLNRNTLEIITNNNKNMEKYQNEIAKISNSISITTETLTAFCNGVLKNYENVIEKYDERFTSLLNLIENSKQNYQEFLGLLKENSNVLKISNKYISKTDDTFKLINKFLEQENSLIKFWEQNKETVSNLSYNLEIFFEKYKDKLNNLNQEYSENINKVNDQVNLIFENYDKNLSSIILNFNNMIENLKITLENINYNKEEIEKAGEFSKKLSNLITEIENSIVKKNYIEIKDMEDKIED